MMKKEVFSKGIKVLFRFIKGFYNLYHRASLLCQFIIAPEKLRGGEEAIIVVKEV